MRREAAHTIIYPSDGPGLTASVASPGRQKCNINDNIQRRVLSRKTVELLFKKDVAYQDAMSWHFDDSKWWCVGRLCRQAHLQEQEKGAAASLINCAA